MGRVLAFVDLGMRIAVEDESQIMSMGEGEMRFMSGRR
jgi:hypothetical protein